MDVDTNLGMFISAAGCPFHLFIRFEGGDLLAAVQQHFRNALHNPFLSGFRLQALPCTSSGESCPAAAAPHERRPHLASSLSSIGRFTVTHATLRAYSDE